MAQRIEKMEVVLVAAMEMLKKIKAEGGGIIAEDEDSVPVHVMQIPSRGKCNLFMQLSAVTMNYSCIHSKLDMV